MPKYDGARDFDFLFGQWKVHNRRLKERLRGSTEWEEFEATSTCRPLLSGFGNEDDFRCTTWRRGFIGTTLRVYDPASGNWFIYWADQESRAGLQPPVVGGWSGGVGTFECDDLFEGRPIRVQFLWSQGPQGRARWEQSFSPDGGATWERNWVMELERA